MDYSKLDKFEINKLIQEYIKPDSFDIKSGYCHTREGKLIWFNDAGSAIEKTVDFCDSWADAGQLMEDNDIELKKNNTKLSSGHYSAIFNTGYCVHHAVDKNPKRAIAICFLMMIEVK